LTVALSPASPTRSPPTTRSSSFSPTATPHAPPSLPTRPPSDPGGGDRPRPTGEQARRVPAPEGAQAGGPGQRPPGGKWALVQPRWEEHTSELQSLAYLVCRLLLEKKKAAGFRPAVFARPHSRRA